MPASLKAKAPSIADYGRNRPTVKIGGFGRLPKCGRGKPAAASQPSETRNRRGESSLPTLTLTQTVG